MNMGILFNLNAQELVSHKTHIIYLKLDLLDHSRTCRWYFSNELVSENFYEIIEL